MRLKLNFSLNNKSAFSLIELSIVILVIGVLIAGVVTGSKMVTKAKISMAANQTKSSVVLGLKDLIFWIETSSTGSVIGSNAADSAPFDGDTVSKWNDINPQSLAKINPVPLAGGESPTYKENGINGLPSILFDAVDDRLVASGISVSRSNSIFAVFSMNTTISASRDLLSIARSDTCVHGLLLEIYFVNYIRNLYRNPMGSGTQSNNLSTGISISNKKNYILSSVKNYDTTSQKVWVNNSVFINDTASTLGDFDYPRQSVTLGNLHCSSGGTARPFDGQISEIIIYNRALKQDEIDDVEAYLSKKYSISLN